MASDCTGPQIHASPRRAARSTAGSATPATHSGGCGRWTGRGWTVSSGNRWNRPSNEVSSVVHTSLRISSASSMRAPRWENTEPCTSYSRGHQPMPTPRVTRPPESWSMVATCSATRTGSWIGSWKMPVPTRIVEVRAATAARNVSGSLMLPAMKWWWPMVTVSKPDSSASSASSNVSRNGSGASRSRSSGSDSENFTGAPSGSNGLEGV